MKIFKKRFFAICLAVLIVFSSSVLSINIKLNKEFSKVSDDFYNGVLVDGNREVSIHSQLAAIGQLAGDLAAIAERNGIDVSEFKDNIDYYNYDILVVHDNISYIHYLYEDILEDIMDVGYALSSAELSANDEQAAINALEEILKAKENIENSSYNERVRKYISELHFPVDVLADFTGAQLPEYFA